MIRKQHTAEEQARAIALVKYAEHNADLATDDQMRQAMQRLDSERSATDYLLLSTNEWKEGNLEQSLRLAYAGLFVGSDHALINACLELRIGTVFHDMASEDQARDAAAERYQAARDIAPDFTLAHVFEGDLLFDQEEYEEAEEAYMTAQELDETDPSIYNSLGYLYQEQGFLTKAEAAFKKATQLSPDIPIVHLHLATIYQEQNRLNEAVAELYLAIDRYPENIEWYTLLGTLLEKQGKNEEAAQIRHRASTLQSGKKRA